MAKKMARKGHAKVIYKGTFVSKQSLVETVLVLDPLYERYVLARSKVDLDYCFRLIILLSLDKNSIK